MDDLLRVIVLGLVQGLTEFLPISSSGHLILVRELFGWEFEDDLTLDVALHLGTTVSVVAFFWREWRQMLTSAYQRAQRSAKRNEPASPYDDRLLMLLALGSIPAAAVGFAFQGYIEEEVRSPLIVGAMLLVFAGVLYLADRLGAGERRIADGGWGDALWVGCAQAVSLVPGVSRSGVTISTALARGFTREDAARFSFLLATPVIVGAGALQIGEALVEGIPAGELGLLFAGAAAAAASGWLAIHYLLRWVRTSSYLPFFLYRVVVGLFVLVYFAW